MSKNNQQCSIFKPNSITQGCLGAIKDSATDPGVATAAVGYAAAHALVSSTPVGRFIKALGGKTAAACGAGAINAAVDNYNTTGCSTNLIGDHHTMEMFGYWNHH
ncbi:MAG: hypothetical protein QMO91_02900 [Candidatus Tisiphia sp.]|nr:hypothetical protein [Candidatus Tisiphia sp.]